MSDEKILFEINTNELDNPFEREKLESLPNYILVELLVRHLKREIKAVEYIKEHTDKLKTIRVPKIDFNYGYLLKLLQGGKDD